MSYSDLWKSARAEQVAKIRAYESDMRNLGWEIAYGKYVGFVKVLANNWRRTIPELLDDLSIHDIGIDDFFKLEGNTTFRLATLLGDVQTIYNTMHQSDPIELAPTISRFSHAFLPVVVFQAGVIDLEAVNDIYEAISIFQKLGFESTCSSAMKSGSESRTYPMAVTLDRCWFCTIVSSPLEFHLRRAPALVISRDNSTPDRLADIQFSRASNRWDLDRF
jgi:hypothetical protein